MCACVGMCIYVQISEKSRTNPLELELQIIRGCLTWVLGAKLGFSGREHYSNPLSHFSSPTFSISARHLPETAAANSARAHSVDLSHLDQRSESSSLAPSRLLKNGLIQGVATNKVFGPRVWLLDALSIWEDDHLVPCILVKRSSVFPLFFGLGYIKSIKHKCGWIRYSLDCPRDSILCLYFFCISGFFHKFLIHMPLPWNTWTCRGWTPTHVCLLEMQGNAAQGIGIYCEDFCHQTPTVLGPKQPRDSLWLPRNPLESYEKISIDSFFIVPSWREL